MANFLTTCTTIGAFPQLLPQVASLLGITVGMFFNFLINRYLVFRGVPLGFHRQRHEKRQGTHNAQGS